MTHKWDFDLIVIGGGSGGVRAARWSASLGAKVAICEGDRFGGTCVIKGCIPKKLMVIASHFNENIQLHKSFGHSISGHQHSWKQLKSSRDKEINRLSALYQNILQKNNVQQIYGFAQFVDENTIVINDKTYTANNFLIATGSTPRILSIPGNEHCLISDDLFKLEQRPQNVIFIGGGYIGVEFAGLLNGLGSDVTILVRKECILTGFDDETRHFLQNEIEKKGVKIITNCEVDKIEKKSNETTVYTTKGTFKVDCVFLTTGRIPNTDKLNLKSVNVEVDSNKAIKVNKDYKTTNSKMYAVGDCINLANLTPVATAQGMSVAEHLFKNPNEKKYKLDLDNIPTAVFSNPQFSTVGLTQEQAKEKFPNEKLEIYTAQFRPLKLTLSSSDEKTFMKVIVKSSDQKVLGIHMVGHDAPEIIQGLAVALKAQLTKSILDSTIGIHPTSAEEFVTLRTPTRIISPSHK